MLKIILLLLFTFNTYAFKSTEAFIIGIYDDKVTISSPKKRSKKVSLIIQNKTFDNIRSEVRSQNKVLKRLNLKKDKKRVIEIDMKGIKKLFFVPIAPPFEAAELRFNKEPYEIPPKK